MLRKLAWMLLALAESVFLLLFLQVKENEKSVFIEEIVHFFVFYFLAKVQFRT